MTRDELEGRGWRIYCLDSGRWVARRSQTVFGSWRLSGVLAEAARCEALEGLTAGPSDVPVRTCRPVPAVPEGPPVRELRGPARYGLGERYREVLDAANER